MAEKKFVMETKNGNVEADIDEIMDMASKGNIDGQYALGMSYLYGWEVEEDHQKAYEYLELAAEGGHYEAMTLLLNRLFTADYEGLEESKIQEYCEKAAKAGVPEAMFYYAMSYMDGVGVEQDYKKSAEWFRKAANRGFIEARNSLAYHYQEGLGVEKDEKKAFTMYKQAANKDCVNAMYQTGACYEMGVGTHPSFPDAIKYYTMAAEKGDIFAMDRLGIIYYAGGPGVKADPELSFDWFLKGALAGNPESMYCLGCYYMDGFGVEKDELEGMRWLNLSKDSGNYEAEALLEKINKEKEMKE